MRSFPIRAWSSATTGISCGPFGVGRRPRVSRSVWHHPCAKQADRRAVLADGRSRWVVGQDSGAGVAWHFLVASDSLWVIVNSRPATLERLRKRLLELRSEILNEGDVAIEPARTDPTAVGGEEEAQALTMPKFGPRAPSSIATSPLHMLLMSEGIANGDTLRGPRSKRIFSCCS